MNFLVFELCDNDFGYPLLCAVEYAKENDFYQKAGEDCVWWKAFIIQFMLAHMLMNRLERDLNQTRKYLEGMTVYSSKHWPCYADGTPLDHDGGSVVFDLNTKLITQI